MFKAIPVNEKNRNEEAGPPREIEVCGVACVAFCHVRTDMLIRDGQLTTSKAEVAR